MNYIYGLFCPVTHELRYVGKTNNLRDRLDAHLRSTRSGRRSYLYNWVRSLFRQGAQPVMKVLRAVDDEQWQQAEREAIAGYLAAGARLTNVTIGGEGVAFIDPNGPAEIARRASLKAAWSRPEAKARLALAMQEVNARPDVKRKRSEHARAVWSQPGFRERIFSISAKRKKSKALSEYWRSNRASVLATMNKPERTAKISAAMTRRNADPEFRKLVGAQEVRKRQAQTLKETWARRKKALLDNPDALVAFIEKRSAAAKLGWQSRRRTR